MFICSDVMFFRGGSLFRPFCRLYPLFLSHYIRDENDIKTLETKATSCLALS